MEEHRLRIFNGEPEDDVPRAAQITPDAEQEMDAAYRRGILAALAGIGIILTAAAYKHGKLDWLLGEVKPVQAIGRSDDAERR